jgi:glutamate 5-kinase
MASGRSGALGRGGMTTKVRAAQLAARSGAATVIIGGRQERVLDRVYQGEDIGTLLLAEQESFTARKQWIAAHLQMRGSLELDDGAVEALRNKGVSLLPVGVRGVQGDFSRGEMVACISATGERVACGLINYGADDTRRIMGLPSDQIAHILGYVDEPELVHRDNMVVFD